MNGSVALVAAPISVNPCTPCPIGADCSAGAATLGRLRLYPGYYRLSNASADVRRCPDAGGLPLNCSSGCVTPRGYPLVETTSGCLGGADVHGQCRDGLGGLFCLLCIGDVSGRYYRPASGDEPAECLSCDGVLGLRLAMSALVLGALIGALQLVRHSLERLARERPMLYSRMVGSWQRYRLPSKLKHLIGPLPGPEPHDPDPHPQLMSWPCIELPACLIAMPCHRSLGSPCVTASVWRFLCGRLLSDRHQAARGV